MFWQWRMWRGMEFHILGAATRKARAPNERLWSGTESKWLADERVDLEGLWYCMSSVRYGGWPVLRILWTKQASLNRISHSVESQWSCLRSSVDVSGETEDCVTTLASTCCTRWRRAASRPRAGRYTHQDMDRQKKNGIAAWCHQKCTKKYV